MNTFRLIALSVVLIPSLIFAGSIESRVATSADILSNRMESRDYIPGYILEAAQCVAAVRSIKAGFIFGGEGSTGLVSCRTEDGWSAPSFLSLGGVKFGLLIGGQVADSVLVFLTPYSRNQINSAKLQLGTELSIALGPVGGGGSSGVIPNAHVLTYTSAVGLYAGLSLDGTVLAHRLNRNAEVYGHEVSPREILLTNGSSAPKVMSPFVNELNRWSK